MTQIPFAQIDAFASKPFQGNQACVMPLEAFLADDVLQAIAAENNVAETAFIVPEGPGIWQLRWFTPAVEVPLCGHATLATAHWLFEHGGYVGERITFQTRKSGALYVSRLNDGRLEMDFPAAPVKAIEVEPSVTEALGGTRPVQAFAGSFLALQFESVDDVLALSPDYKALAEVGLDEGDWDRGNVGCYALGGEDVDITSRFFAPGSGIDEDPATGSWHCFLASIIGSDFGRAIKCHQAYPGRGADIEIELKGDRVNLRGMCVTVIEGVFRL